MLLKNNVKGEWWRAMLQQRDDIVALDWAIIQNPKVWEASGHLAGFTDPLVQCLGECKQRFREDDLREEQLGAEDAEGEIRCPVCGGELSEPRQFNLMFETFVGPVQDEANKAYLRPETAQGIFINFKNVLSSPARSRRSGSPRSASRSATRSPPATSSSGPSSSSRWRWSSSFPPPGAQVARALDGGANALVHRTRHPGRPLRLRAHGADELSHYSTATSDIEYLFPMGWSEPEGIANRGDFDLTQHAKFSGEKLEYVDSGRGDRYVPYVIELAAGVDRAMLSFMVDAYDVEEVEGRERTVLRLHPRLAPVKVAVLPLVNKDGQPEKAREIYEGLRQLMSAEYDTGGSIGKRYRRQDEIGTPWGVTVDHQTMEDDTVTLRDRDTLDQSRIAIPELAEELSRRLGEPWTSPKLGAAPRRRTPRRRRRSRRRQRARRRPGGPPSA